MEAWTVAGGWAHSTVRSYQGAVAIFLSYVCDPRYGWVAECEARVGARPVQVCHEDNLAVHVADYEGRPGRRPLTREELQAFFDAADERVERAAASGRKGWLATFRDATLFKVVYGWGLRRREAVQGRPPWNSWFKCGRRCGGRLGWRSGEPHLLARYGVPPVR